MKLCHIVASLDARHGGPSKSVLGLCRALARLGHDVELLTASETAPAEGLEHRTPENLRVRTFRRDWPDRICPSAGLKRAALKCGATVIHHHALWLRTLHYAYRTARKNSVPLVLSPRGMMSDWAWSHHRVRKALADTLVHPGALAGTTAWHATSGGEEADIRARGYTQPIAIAPNGVNAPDDEDVRAAREYWHATCPETRDRRTAVFYGRFHQKKRVIELLDVWVERAPRDWLLLMVGLPEDYTAEMLEAYAHRMSAAGRIRAFNGANRPAPYAVASLFVLASHNENFGLAVAEAMAHGVAPLVTDTMPWHGVGAQDCGWCVPWARFGDTVEIATAEPPDGLAARGARAKTWVLREFSWDRPAEALTKLYEQLAAG